ncbi:Cof-type HAD-IIB family hydrolase [Lachnobacterium bovis]|uniref:Cof-type HAD-IIB family hydrolase n=1 Tax=Lachnobacterium bovis TaxID=140626 RepID=UPI0003B4E179|nr:Cof-type HAD-IIB family hydrolase [Lachnobacterium bovis]
MVKLVATDMDGTLLDSSKNLPKDFKEWVLKNSDIKTVIASGRQYFTLEKDFIDIKDNLIFIAENGGLVFAKNKIIYKNVINIEDIAKSLKFIESFTNAHPIICGAKSAYMHESVEEDVVKNATMYYEKLEYVSDLLEAAQKDDIVKIAVFFENKEAEKYYNQFSALPNTLNAVLSGVSWIDIAKKNVNKGVAIKAIQDNFNITQEESMAFGDYLNDYEMLQNCKYSYAMSNAHDKIKEVANNITKSNDEDGVMCVLRNL